MVLWLVHFQHSTTHWATGPFSTPSPKYQSPSPKWVAGCGFTVGWGVSASSLFWVMCPQHNLPLMPGLLLRLPSFPGSLDTPLCHFLNSLSRQFLYFVQTPSPYQMTPLHLTWACASPFLRVFHCALCSKY